MGIEQSYILRLEDENNFSSYDLPVQSSPYIEQAATMAIMNNYGSDCIIRVKNLQISELIARTTTAITYLDLYRITGVIGGESIDILAHDSATSLPSQVSAVKYPRSVTTTGNYLRRILSQTGNNMTTTLLNHYSLAGKSTGNSGGLNLNHTYSGFNSSVQRYVLREGEGISIKTSLTAPQNYPMQLVVTFSDGTNTFLVRDLITIRSSEEFFSLYNGVGSGTILYVTRIELRHINTADVMKIFSIESCSYVYDGTDISLIKKDSANLNPDSKLSFKANCVVRQANLGGRDGRNQTWGTDMTPWRRLAVPAFGTGANLANGLLTLRPKVHHTSTDNREDIAGISQIVLREGEGLCIINKTFSYFGRYSITALITIEDNGGVVSGGESSYVF